MINNEFSITFLRKIPEWLDFGIMDKLLTLMKVTNDFEEEFSKFEEFDEGGFGYICLIRIFTGLLMCIIGSLIVFLMLLGLTYIL